MKQKLYTFVGTVDGSPVGFQKGATVEDIASLMACGEHSSDYPNCWDCQGLKNFLTDLRVNGQAMSTDRTDGQVWISSAVYEGMSE